MSADARSRALWKPATATAAASSTASISRSMPARWSPSSARTAPANRRCSKASSTSRRVAAATFVLDGASVFAVAGADAARSPALPTCRRTAACSPSSPVAENLRHGRIICCAIAASSNDALDELQTLFPILAERRRDYAGEPLRRRAAHAGDRAHAGHGAEARHARRAFDRARAAHGRSGVCHGAQACRARQGGADGRAEREKGAGRPPTAATCWNWAASRSAGSRRGADRR